MPKPKKKQQPPTMSDVLRETMLAADIPLLTLEQQTGVARASLRFFMRGERSLHLDVADKLATYFGLVLVKQGAE